MLDSDCCHCEEQSDEAISKVVGKWSAGDCFASLAMTPLLGLQWRI